MKMGKNLLLVVGSMVSPLLYFGAMTFLLNYGLWVPIIVSVLMMYEGLLLVVRDQNTDTWKGCLGLLLVVNPILLLIAYFLPHPLTSSVI